MTSWSLRPASRARNAPAVWMPSWEFPANRITASWIFSGLKSARSDGGLPLDAEVAGAASAGAPVGALFDSVVAVDEIVASGIGKTARECRTIFLLLPEQSPVRAALAERAEWRSVAQTS